jgi:hypothetical protein
MEDDDDGVTLIMWLVVGLKLHRTRVSIDEFMNLQRDFLVCILIVDQISRDFDGLD